MVWVAAAVELNIAWSDLWLHPFALFCSLWLILNHHLGIDSQFPAQNKRFFSEGVMPGCVADARLPPTAGASTDTAMFELSYLYLFDQYKTLPKTAWSKCW